jgi:thymidylate kinase
MEPREVNGRTRFISFSGIDGAGKSTQIDNLRTHLQEMGQRVQLITFWNEVAKLTRIRESGGHALFKGDKGVGTPSAPVERRDKNVRSPLMTCLRLCFYLLDAVSLNSIVKRALRSNVDVVIFDRYIYDEFANLPLQIRAVRAYIRLLLKLVPKPDVAYVLDADPFQARARKPEYPIEFLHVNRDSYRVLSDLVGGMVAIGPMPIRDVEQEVLRHALKMLSLHVVRDPNVEEKPDRPYARSATS